MIAWFLCPYKVRADKMMGRPLRYCAMDDFTQQIIYTDGGNWTESEVLGNHAIVKVKASEATIATINAATGFIKLPKKLLTEALSDLTVAQKTAIRDKILELGYTTKEIRNALGSNIGDKTLADVLRFIATRRRKPRYDADTDTVILDGIDQECRSIESVDGEITE